MKRRTFPLVILTWQFILILSYAFLSLFDQEFVVNSTLSFESLEKDTIKQYYGLFQDVNVMIYVGFGFLMAFLKGHSMGSITLNFLLAVLSMQTSIILNHLFHCALANRYEKLVLSLPSLIGGNFAAGAVLIAFGALLGRLSPTQSILIPLILLPFYALNESIAVVKYQSVDMGGSMLIHLFGAFFGTACAAVLNTRLEDGRRKHNPSSNDYTNTIAFIGTLFLWMYWPSFNGALAIGNSQHRVVINTVLSLCGSCASTFALSHWFNQENKFDPEHLLNATLAGGVAIGSSSDLVVAPWTSLLIGCIAGIVSTVGFHWFSPILNKGHVVDTCGVMNLHGIPGIIGGVAGGISASTAGSGVYGDRIESIFPAMGTNGRSAADQAGFQFACLLTSLVLSTLGGSLAGLILSFFNGPEKYDDDQEFLVVRSFGEPERRGDENPVPTSEVNTAATV